MPAPLGGKRVKGVSVFRPFVFGNISRPIDSDHRPPDVPSDHSHQWTVWVKGVNDEDISYWLKKVQFKLHDTYASSLRGPSFRVTSPLPSVVNSATHAAVVEQPPFEITETGWGEFEMAIKLYFVPESGEKPQTIWHTLKIHPWGPDAEAQRVEKRPIISQNYEEIIFNEPVEAFYDLLTGGGGHASEKPSSARGKAAAAKGASKQAHAVAARVEAGARTAEIPLRSTRENPYSRDTEGKELDRMRDAVRKVEELIRAERETLKQREAALEEFKTSDESGGKK